MPIYEYEARDPASGCARCRVPFEQVQRLEDPPLARCPDCGQPLRKLVSRPAIGPSATGYDHKAKQAGFHKLKKLSKGEYEVQY